MGLFNIKLLDPDFYVNACEDSIITIDKNNKTVHIGGVDKVYHYQQSEIEETMLDAGGVMPLYNQFGSTVFRHITAPKRKDGRQRGNHNGIGDATQPSKDW